MGDFMFAHVWRRRAAAIAATALAAMLAACSQAPQRFLAPDPSDPRAPAAPAAYRPVLGAYESQRPVEPQSWRDQNDRIAPKP